MCPTPAPVRGMPGARFLLLCSRRGPSAGPANPSGRAGAAMLDCNTPAPPYRGSSSAPPGDFVPDVVLPMHGARVNHREAWAS